MRRALVFLPALAVASFAPRAFAGDFDALGNYVADPSATDYVDFAKTPARYVPSDADPTCVPPQFKLVKKDDALDSGSYITLQVQPNCVERISLSVPAKQARYRATVWMRHGGLSARLNVLYPDDSGLDLGFAVMAPTGRTTSDGWVEMASNELSIDGTKATAVYLRAADFASTSGVDIDALELVESGTFQAQKDCAGYADTTCSGDNACVFGRCIEGGDTVPPLPNDQVKGGMIDVLEGRLRIFFGGRYSRANYLPKAIDLLEQARVATSAFTFWNDVASAVHALHDWHTDTYGFLNQAVGPRTRLNACFIEGDADLTHEVWPSDPRYEDILVSHVGPDSGGLKTGDRLVAIDGLHPIEWARALAEINWGFHVATDPNTYGDLVELLGGPYWIGGADILAYASNFTVLHCDASAGTCDPTPDTIEVASLTTNSGGSDVACDNRPFYHLATGGPDPTTHYVFNTVFRGPILGTTHDEAIDGMVWDDLFGTDVNQPISDAIADWKANARGVILDHRAGNGGTLDAAENVTKLVRPKETIAVQRIPMEIGGDDGPVDNAAGLAIFNQFKGSAANAYVVGDADYDPDLPVALIIHRDGSASDYMPFGMKGAPHTKLFGPHPTAGAFSTYISLEWWSFGFQFASGDTLGSDGSPLIGHGVAPDFVVQQKQSDLLNGKDTIHEAALAWVRQELKKP